MKANVKYFKSIWENYALASGLHTRPQNEQIAVLLSAIGEDCYKCYENFPLTAEDRVTTVTLLAVIEKNLVPESNKRYERALFNLTAQKEKETIDQYVNRLQIMVKTCPYRCDAEGCGKDLSEEFLLDKLCISISIIK